MYGPPPRRWSSPWTCTRTPHSRARLRAEILANSHAGAFHGSRRCIATAIEPIVISMPRKTTRLTAARSIQPPRAHAPARFVSDAETASALECSDGVVIRSAPPWVFAQLVAYPDDAS